MISCQVTPRFDSKSTMRCRNNGYQRFPRHGRVLTTVCLPHSGMTGLMSTLLQGTHPTGPQAQAINGPASPSAPLEGFPVQDASAVDDDKVMDMEVVEAPTGAGIINLPRRHLYPGLPCFDDLPKEYIGERLILFRKIPTSYWEGDGYFKGITQVKEVLMRLCGIKNLYVAQNDGTVILTDQIFLPHKQSRSEVAPVEDLRLADQMVCLSVVSRVQDYTYWYFQFFSTEQVSRLLGVDERGDWANTDILRRISDMTCTQVHILSRDPQSWRTCFMLVGVKELVLKAVNQLIGAMQSGKKPELDLQWMEDRDARLSEIKAELQDMHGLHLIATERDGNCLFRALSYALVGHPHEHEAVRQALVDRLQHMSEALELAACIDSVSPEEYSDKMRSDGWWGGHTEVVAFAALNHVAVRIFFENELLGLRYNDVEPPPDANGRIHLDDRRFHLLNYHSHYWLLTTEPQAPIQHHQLPQAADRRWAHPA